MLQGKRIILGITGSIAAYKSAMLVRLLMKRGAEVIVMMTPAAKEFITPLTLSTLSRNPVISEFFSRADGSWHSHVDLGLWADAMLVAPASASTIGKMANGIADNMLITTYLSCKAPVFVAPAMDLDMFAHPATQRNLQTLISAGNIIVEPKSGELASGLDGKGRMEEPEKIVIALEQFFEANLPLKGKHILITAGPTYEKIDPVRFIGNYSSGKMGFALANACALQGAKVTLICGPVSLKTTHPAIERVDVESACEMYDQTVARFPQTDGAILCAAVADYRPAERAENKIKRKDGNLTIELIPNPDIAARLGAIKRKEQVLAGFALESENELSNAKGKLERKNLDFIVLNSMNDKEATFGYDTNKISIIAKDGDITQFELKTKDRVAEDIVDTFTGYLTKAKE